MIKITSLGSVTPPSGIAVESYRLSDGAEQIDCGPMLSDRVQFVLGMRSWGGDAMYPGSSHSETPSGYVRSQTYYRKGGNVTIRSEKKETEAAAVAAELVSYA